MEKHKERHQKEKLFFSKQVQEWVFQASYLLHKLYTIFVYFV